MIAEVYECGESFFLDLWSYSNGVAVIYSGAVTIVPRKCIVVRVDQKLRIPQETKIPLFTGTRYPEIWL